MKTKSNEWVSIADLMAGVVAVVMLLLVVSFLQRLSAEQLAREKDEMVESTRQQKVANLLISMENEFKSNGLGALISVDSAASELTLRDGVFSRGSACLTSNAEEAILALSVRLKSFLTDFPTGRVFVEGHTDNVPVSSPVTDFKKFCTVYDDNYTLSAARARETRKLFVTNLGSSLSKRIIVAGYGDSQPLKDIPPEDASNRRVQVRLVVSEN
ncbi:OmpA/MotB family protein [Cellvibrio sp. QJXJ]|uniref:OmpA/MotB family protein n=1 Tax=Cellvibrio sp. QJXJ TaxID=2964606 RepID=UPI0021C36427|nr:OmpA family protein [Cellvibrio sp. QJXJ]UUA71348.1 OmpA family protein [Cellvibrio sp. QJXJ]